MEPEVVKAGQAAAVNGELACADAHDIAARLRITPQAVGKAINSGTVLRFNRCQLGVFGYGPKAEGKSKIIVKAAWVPDEIKAALLAQSHAGHIACKAVWDVAEQFKYPRLGLANIVEALGLRVIPCQLGCF